MTNIEVNMLYSEMSHSQLLTLLPVMFAGAALGVIFFAGLFWTVQRGPQSTTPALWFLSSFVLRTSITLTGIYLLTNGQWPRLLACMFGFICARIVVLKITKPAPEQIKKQESNDAP